MKLVLQHAGQSVEYEFVTGQNTPLTNAQATAVINLAYIVFGPENDSSPTTLEKAQYLVKFLGQKMLNTAKERRRFELQSGVDATVTSELG